ncbi:MAG: S-layer homology domain-containing protein [Clostridia bacterium]|nr:S-layer homology domain-containing protein [Clostridia bacterium]
MDPEAAGEYELDFSDKEAIPEDLLGYVRAIVANGIMKGYENNVFQPNKPVTRAEMAVLLDRLGDLLHEQENRRVEGTLVKLDSDYITLQIEDTVKELALADDVLVYLNRENVELEDLVAGDRVRLAVKDGKVVLIRAQRAAVVETTHQGRLIRLVLGTSSKVTMMEKDTELTFKVDENTRIRVAGKRALLKDLEVGREVAVTAQGDLAVRIEQE